MNGDFDGLHEKIIEMFYLLFTIYTMCKSIPLMSKYRKSQNKQIKKMG